MLKVVDASSNKILFVVDAWVSDCFERAQAFADQNNWFVVRKEITFMGDMIWWVA